MDRINDVNVNETISKLEQSENPTVIEGHVEFDGPIFIDGKAEVNFLNGNNVTELYEKSILVDQDVVIEGNIVSNFFLFFVGKTFRQINFLIRYDPTGIFNRHNNRWKHRSQFDG